MCCKLAELRKCRRSAFAEHRMKQRQRNIINTLQTQHQKSLKIQQWNESYETKGQADLQARTQNGSRENCKSSLIGQNLVGITV